MKNLFSKTNLCWLVTIILSFFLIQILVSANIINNVGVTVLMTIGINIILAVSLNLIIGITGQFSLGHAGFMVIGAYATGVVITHFEASLLGVILGMLLGMLLSGIVSFVVSLPILRLKGDYLAIATLGFGEIIRIVILNMDITNGAAGMILPKLIGWEFIFIMVVLVTIIILNFSISAKGRACISIREDEIAAEAMGINTTNYKVLAFVIGAIMASVAGALYASSFYVIKPDMFSFSRSIDVLVLVVFGGMGSYTGSFLSSFIISIINVTLQQFAAFRTIIYGVALVVIMIFKPSGILGKKEFSFTKIFSYLSKKKEAKV